MADQQDNSRILWIIVSACGDRLDPTIGKAVCRSTIKVEEQMMHRIPTGSKPPIRSTVQHDTLSRRDRSPDFVSDLSNLLSLS
jgi:hypothetical protein